MTAYSNYVLLHCVNIGFRKPEQVLGNHLNNLSLDSKMNIWKYENYNNGTNFISSIKLITQVWDFALPDAFSISGEFNATYMQMC